MHMTVAGHAHTYAVGIAGRAYSTLLNSTLPRNIVSAFALELSKLSKWTGQASTDSEVQTALAVKLRHPSA